MLEPALLQQRAVASALARTCLGSKPSNDTLGNPYKLLQIVQILGFLGLEMLNCSLGRHDAQA